MASILSQTYDDVVAVTPSDTVPDPAGPFSGLMVTAAGALKIHTARGSVTTFAGTSVGQQIFVPIDRVYLTGTSATVVGLVSSAGVPVFK
jgi:hypothetical protein